MKIVILGLTITSSWGNGHATTYRALCKALAARGHSMVFVEKDVPWYRNNRDLARPGFATVLLYEDWRLEQARILRDTADADLVMVGSYFPDGVAAAEALFSQQPCPIFFYDIDTPVTLEALRTCGGTEAILAAQIPHYDAYLSFTGGPALDELRTRFGARRALPLYCSVDTQVYRPVKTDGRYACDLSYLGTYSQDRQPKLERMLLAVARFAQQRQFVVAGAQYPEMEWPANVTWMEHVAPKDHPAFYSSARFTLNLTRDAMVRAGYSPSVRLFEAAACGAAIVSDTWPGMETFLTPGEEILLAGTTAEVEAVLNGTSDQQRLRIGRAARERILEQHAHTRRAQELEAAVEAARIPTLA